MCKSASEPGGPYRCAAHTRARLSRAEEDFESAQEALESLMARAADGAEVDKSALARARERLVAARRRVEVAQACYDATGDGLGDLEALRVRQIVAGDVEGARGTWARIGAATDRINTDLARRRQKWGEGSGLTAYAPVVVAQGPGDGDAGVVDFVQGLGLRAHARRYQGTRDDPGGSWHVHLSRPGPDGGMRRLSIIMPERTDGRPPTMGDVMDAVAGRHGDVLARAGSVDEGGDLGGVVAARDHWEGHLLASGGVVSAGDLEDADYSAWAFSRGAVADPGATAVMVDRARQMGAAGGAGFTADEGEAHAARLALRGVGPEDLDDEGFRAYVLASGNYPAWVAAQARSIREGQGVATPLDASGSAGSRLTPASADEAPAVPAGGGAGPVRGGRLTREDRRAVVFFGIAVLSALAVYRLARRGRGRARL